MARILILHPGEMGTSLGVCLKTNGHQVCWVSKDRSDATHARAKAEGFIECYSLIEGVRETDVVLSICPPEYAMDVAWSIVDCSFDGIFVDANATSPMTVKNISKIFGQNFVDGSVIGPPAHRANATRLYLAGRRAAEVLDLFAGTNANPTNLGTQPTAASALKMCYAAYTKGTSALLLNIRALAEANQVTDALLAEWAISQPDLQTRSERTGPGVSRKAWRFAAEMLEIAETFKHSGLPAGFHQGAAAVYERLSAFKDQPPAATTDLVNHLLNED